MRLPCLLYINLYSVIRNVYSKSRNVRSELRNVRSVLRNIDFYSLNKTFTHHSHVCRIALFTFLPFYSFTFKYPFYSKNIFFLKNICTLKVFVVTLQPKNLGHKFERNTIIEYEKVIYNSFTDAFISKHHGHRF